MKKIVQAEDPVLRELAKEIPLTDIGGTKLSKLIADMNEALDSQEDGVAIAAPQIGAPLRLFIVSGKVLPKRGGETQSNQVYINPVIKKRSGRKIIMEEGCLSVRWVYGKTKRSDKIQIEAINEKGHKFVRQGTGLIAQIFQHETDHLNGVLFIDKASHLQEIKPETEQ